MKRISKKDLEPYKAIAWEYFKSRYPPGLLTPDFTLKAEIKAIAELIYLSSHDGQKPTFEEIDYVRYCHDFIENVGPRAIYKIYMVLYNPNAWERYKNHSKSRTQGLLDFERNVKEIYKNGKNR